MRIMTRVVAVVIVGCAAVSAQTQEQRPVAQASGAAGEITLVGCVQPEADYRRQQDRGRGGVAGTGLGRGNEYILVQAIGSGSGPAETEVDCRTVEATSGAPGEAYELTGESERKLEAYVGRKVAVTGMLKEADTEPVGTSGTVTTPTGGFDPLGQDLRLFELNVTSFSEVTNSTATVPPTDAPPAPVAEAIPTTGIQQSEAAVREDQLPRTASPLPIAGLLSLLSFGGAFAVRKLRS